MTYSKDNETGQETRDDVIKHENQHVKDYTDMFYASFPMFDYEVYSEEFETKQKCLAAEYAKKERQIVTYGEAVREYIQDGEGHPVDRFGPGKVGNARGENSCCSRRNLNDGDLQCIHFRVEVS